MLTKRFTDTSEDLNNPIVLFARWLMKLQRFAQCD